MPRFGNSSVSGLLSASKAAYERTQSYNDSIAAYEYELSDKSEDDFKKYQSYLSTRAAKTTDPSKQLSLQKTLTSANRAFRSNEIARATLDVNYGEIDDTQKYNKMYGLLQDAIGNGDYSQAQSIESQMSSLSIKIQNAKEAAANKAAAAGSKAQGAGWAARSTQIHDLENKLDRAYQTGQPIKGLDGVEKQMNAADYAMAQATILSQKYNLLQEKAQTDPKYQDDISALEKSPEYRGLIDSGIIKFGQDGMPIASEAIKNLAVGFKTDNYGNTVRTFTAPPMKDGKQQFGLTAGEDGKANGRFIVNRQLNNTTTDPNQLGRVAYNSKAYINEDGKAVDGILERYSGNQRGDLLSGNRVLIDPKTGLQAASYTGTRIDKQTGKLASRTPEQAREDLKLLAHPTDSNFWKGTGSIFDLGNAAQTYEPLAKATGDIVHAGGEALGAVGKAGQSLFAGNPMNAIGNLVSFGQKKQAEERAKQAAAAAAAERQRQQVAAQARLAEQARISQLNAAQNKKTPSILYQPKPLTLQQKVANLAGATSPKQVASGIGDIVGYNSLIKKIGW